MPMSVKRMIQTVEITHPGGVNSGLFNVAYQVETELLVKKEPMIPADWQMSMQTISLGSSWICIFISLLIFD
jgi:hypothetical protein